MGCQDSFSQATNATIAAFFIVILANFCNMLSFTTTSWHVTSLPLNSNGDLHLGLWRECRTNLITGCSSLDGYGDSTFAVIQALSVIAFIFVNIGNALIILYLFGDGVRKNAELGVFAGLSLLLAGITWAMALVVFALGYDEDGADLGYSFGFAAASALLSLVAGSLILFASRKDRSKARRHAKLQPQTLGV